MKIIRNLFVVVLLFGIGFFIFRVDIEKGHFIPGATHADSIFIFPGLTGPMDSTVIPPMHHTSWGKYATGENFGIAVVLLDTGVNSNWMGLAHAFKAFGIPFKFYYKTDIDQAVKNDVVYVYPMINDGMNGSILAKLAEVPRRGGTLIGQCVESGLTQVFGFGGAVGSDQNYKIRISDFDNPMLKEFTDPFEREISIANPQIYHESEGTYGYTNLAGKPLMVYPDGKAFLTEKDYPGGGRAFAFGMDLGYWTLVCQNELSLNAYRKYANIYEPSLDMLIRIVKNMYVSGSKTAVTLGSVQDNKKITLCITHDIDYWRSMYNALDYAKMEYARKIQTTYFVQVKYLQDWNDIAYFNDSAADAERQLDSMKMEIASHTICHSKEYRFFPIGSGTEKYPTYHPLVKSKTYAINGTVLGELRVSKFLLDHFLPKDQQVVSFRPGELSDPFALPQCLLATGYKYSSNDMADDMVTHMPIQLNYNRSFQEELPEFEFPITIEDEELPQMDQRLDSALAVAHKIARYGGLMCCLIHPNVVSYKYKFEVGLLDSMQSTSHVTTIKDFGAWWAARNEVSYYVNKTSSGFELHINTPAPISDLTFFVPPTWTCSAAGESTRQTGNSVLVKNVTNDMTINFTSR
jgi:hypothetical protein